MQEVCLKAVHIASLDFINRLGCASPALGRRSTALPIHMEWRRRPRRAARQGVQSAPRFHRTSPSWSKASRDTKDGSHGRRVQGRPSQFLLRVATSTIKSIANYGETNFEISTGLSTTSNFYQEGLQAPVSTNHTFQLTFTANANGNPNCCGRLA